MAEEYAGPLAGVRVLDLTWVLSGPYATLTLADLGAEVIKVERPRYGDIARGNGPFIPNPGGEPVSSYFFSVNRGKLSVALDLKDAADRARFLRLVAVSDVLVENFVPGTMAKLGLGAEVLRAQNPRLIYAACSGFGQTGPYAQKPALDAVVQGMGGIMSITGEPGGPPIRPGLSLGDIAAGLYLAIGILSALVQRARTGEGCTIDVGMLDCQVAIQENAFARYFATGQVPQPLGTRHPVFTPFQAFQTADGWLVLAMTGGEKNQWALFCAALDRVDLIDDPRFETGQTRTDHYDLLEPVLSAELRKKTTAEWVSEFEALEIPCGPLLNIAEVAAHPQVRARHMLVDVPHPTAGPIRTTALPIKFDGHDLGPRRPAPELGEHTEEVLRRLAGEGG